MTTYKKGRTGGHQATPKTSKYTHDSTGLVSRTKVVLITLALWGWFPIGLAQRISRMGGQHDE